MVGLCRYIYKGVLIIVSVSMYRLLMMLILCAFVFQSWNVTKASAVHQIDPPSHRDMGGARGLRFHEEVAVDDAVPNLSPSGSGLPFEGMLAADGSISSVKLLMESERDQSADSSPANRARRRPAGQYWKNQRGGKHKRDPAQRAEVFEKKYPPCPEELRDLIPCLNAAQGHLYGRCPNANRGPAGSCVIPAPKYYSREFKWPASKTQVRGPNVPNVPLLQQNRAAWLRAHGNTIFVEDGDPRFPNGTSEYVRHLAMMIKDHKFGTDIRLALDIGCGSGSVAAALEAQGILTLSIAAADSADNGVQLVVERGYPALLQSLGAQRFPYPSQAFDLIHCGACDVQWEAKGGLKMLEIDRILRAGGFVVWNNESEGGANWKEMEEMKTSICWRKVAKWGGEFALWQKPTNQTCYMTRELPTPPLCSDSVSPDKSWNVPAQNCLVGFPGTGSAIISAWPIRLQTPPPRLEQTPCAGIAAAKSEAFLADLNYWVYILAFYVVDFGPVRASEIHNVLDMNAGFGGFAAAVSMKSPPLQWWVLNVVPIDRPDRLAVVFDRGLLGVYHDWCESLDVYPRAFDMIHSSGLFSSTLRCEVSDVVQEMDRLLRPGGFAIIRDQEEVVLHIQTITTALHWKATVEDTESGPFGKDKVLNCQKTYWQPRLGNSGKS